MAQEVEIEFKNLLTLEEFQQLKKELFDQTESVTQINYYFETSDFQLQASGAALRIRKKADNYVLTLKEPHPEGLLETHDSLSKAEVESWIANAPLDKVNVGKQLKNLDVSIDELQYVGNLTTVRLERAYNDDIIIVLDHSTYNDTEDFEFELEASTRPRGEAVFQKIMEQNQISIKPTANKIERFFTSLQEK